MKTPSLHRFALACTATMLLAGPARAGWPHDPAVNVPVCTAALGQGPESTAPDGAGGAFVSFYDNRGGNTDIYIQHLGPGGASLWATDGVVVCNALGSQGGSQVVPDGSGGVFVCWYDLRNGVSYQVFAQHLNAAGAALWTLNGLPLAPTSKDQLFPRIIADGSGGMIAVWADSRNTATTGTDVYAQRVSGAGALQWSSSGLAVCTAVQPQTEPDLILDEVGRAVMVWTDSRNSATTGTDIYAQAVTLAGIPQWIANGTVVCNAASTQQSPRIVNDGALGSVFVWLDARGGGANDIYAQRLNSGGGPYWAANGVAVTNDVASQAFLQAAADGQGGAFVAWSDNRNDVNTYDCFAQDVSNLGANLWSSTGLPLCTAPGSQFAGDVVADGRGGCIVSWTDARSAQPHAFAQRVLSGSTRWTFNGTQLSNSAGGSFTPLLAADGNGGAIGVFGDYRAISSYPDVYAQGVDAFGYLGAEPSIASVRDVPFDQGGQVKLSWNASPLDTDPNFSSVLFDYLLYRSVPPQVALARLSRGAHAVAASSFDGRDTHALLTTRSASSTIYWENIAHEPARHLAGYSHVVPTTSDSVGAGNPRTQFMVMAENSSGSLYWTSAADSGYSVDNLPPVAPAPFTGQYGLGTAALHWNRNVEADLAGYRLYRGTSVSFVPNPAHLVANLADTGYVDAAGQPYVYKLSAIDVHGNESPVATLVPTGALAVGDAAPRALFLASPAPDPLRAGARATLRFGLPADAAATLALYDVGGRRVRELAGGRLAAGEHAVALEASDARGRALASGLYFVRLESGGRTLVRRVTVLE